MTSHLDTRSIYLRSLVLRMVDSSRRGHIGSAYSLIEILRVLYDDIVNISPSDPTDKKRDRVILSKGNGCLAQYAILADKGFIDMQSLDEFCLINGLLGGHPEPSIPGIEVATGSLGHGLSMGVGMALSARIDKMKHHTFVILGDGECDEGSVWEAALSAGYHHLDSLTVIIDYNHMQSYGKTKDILDLEPFSDKWISFGWAVYECDGHNISELQRRLKNLPFKKGKPSCLICHTIKGKGIPMIEGNASWHHRRGITDEDMRLLSDALETQSTSSS